MLGKQDHEPLNHEYPLVKLCKQVYQPPNREDFSRFVIAFSYSTLADSMRLACLSLKRVLLSFVLRVVCIVLATAGVVFNMPKSRLLAYSSGQGFVRLAQALDDLLLVRLDGLLVHIAQDLQGKLDV